jgi:cytochrome oxidase assembly protein ShyY1
MELRRNRTQLQEVAMITALVRFRLPQGTSREDAKAMFEKSAPNYRGIPGLVRKYYLYGDDQTGGGVYLWSSRDAAERFYSDSWKSTIAQRYGAQPEILFFETPVIVENAQENAVTAAA